MVEHKCGHKNYVKHVYEYEQCKAMQDIREKERVERKKIQTQTSGYVSRVEPLLYVPAFTQKDFYYLL